MYTIRITTPRDDELICSFFESYKVVLYFELGQNNDNPHYQGMLEVTDIRKLRNAIAYKFGSGNKTHSLTQVIDEDKYSRYIVKDGNLVVNTLWDAETLSYHIKNQKEYVEDTKQVRTGAKPSFAQTIVDTYKPETLFGGSYRVHILKHVKSKYKGGKLHSNNVIQSIINGIVVQHYPNEWAEKFMTDRFWE